MFTFDQASSGGGNVYVSPVLYGYDPNLGANGQYVQVVSATGPYSLLAQKNGLATTMAPFQGYWIYAYQGNLRLSIPTGG
jgi:hypothetical protein